MLVSPAHLYMPQLFTHCLPTITCVMLSIVFVFLFSFGCIFCFLFFYLSSGFPHGIESIEKVLNFKIGFQDLEKVLNFAKMYIRY